MLKRSDMFDYQRALSRFILQNPQASLWVDMGLGKTVSTLDALNTLSTFGQSRGVLVVAPLRVCQTVWPVEIKEWEHLQHLTHAQMAGLPPATRRAALDSGADILTINYENLKWLMLILRDEYLKRGRQLPFDTIVWDEITKMKDPTSKRSRSVIPILPWVERSVGLTGTPASNGMKDLHGQYKVIDGGERLERTKGMFYGKYFHQYGFNLELKYGAEETIRKKVADITVDLNKEDYLDLPDVKVNDIEIELPKKQKDQYKKLEKEFVLEVTDDEVVEAFNTAAKMNKCLQYCNGAVYDENQNTIEVHDLKLDALEEIIEEAGGSPVLIGYNFKCDAQRIMKRFPKAVNMTGAKNTESIIERWNKGDIPLLIGHPQSMGHGLNLQKGGHIIAWFGVPWSLDNYAQFNARLDRQGQKYPVMIHRILVKDSVDMLVAKALSAKEITETALREAVRAMRG